MANLDCSVNGKDRDLCLIGDSIAKMRGFEHLTEPESIYRYIIDKYNWLPSQVRELTKEDLRLLLEGYNKDAFNKVEVMP